MNRLKKLIVLLFCLQTTWFLQAHQPITLFCHGIVDNHTQMDRYEEFVEHPRKNFDFTDAQKPTDLDLNTLIFNAGSAFGKTINRNNMAMSYGADIQTLKQHVDAHQEYILYGVSRGGATIINYLAQYNPTNIAGIVLDAAPSDVVFMVDALQHIIGYKFAPDRATQEDVFHSFFPAYKKNSTPIVKNIANIHNKKLPIFIVNSQDDERVYISSAWQLYLAFIQAGFQHVYLCQLAHGLHANYMYGPDKDVYLHDLHSFYKKYGFAYHKKYATLKNLAHLQPSVQEITKKLQLYKEKMETDYETQKAANLNYSCIAIVTLLAASIAWKVARF